MEIKDVFNRVNWGEFKSYCLSRYSKKHAKNVVYFARKYGQAVLSNPLILKSLGWRTAKYILESLSAL